MFFKNARIFRISPSRLPLSSDIVETKLAQHGFTPCGAVEWSRSGWVPPTRVEHAPFIHSVSGQWLITLLIEEKVLPAAVIKKHLAERAAEMEAAQGHAPGKKALRELKTRLVDELLPKAFTKVYPLRAWLDPKHGWIVVDTSSDSKAEYLVSALIQTLDNLPVAKVMTQFSPSAKMKAALEIGEGPSGFTLDRDCELKGVGGDGDPSVRFSRHDLDGDDVRIHLQNGKLPTKLGMTWNDKVSFVITDKLGLNRLAFINLEESSASSAEEAFDADFTIVTSELSGLLADLIEWLGGEQRAGDTDDETHKSLAEAEG